jgi:myo-inositol-1-phosphate synthase
MEITISAQTAAPIVLDLALFMDMAQRSEMRRIQEWLSFYFKSP